MAAYLSMACIAGEWPSKSEIRTGQSLVTFWITAGPLITT